MTAIEQTATVSRPSRLSRALQSDLWWSFKRHPSAIAAAILLLILGREHLREFFVLGVIALWVAVLTAVLSAIDYYRRFSHVISGREAD